jgi:hypothetical protein
MVAFFLIWELTIWLQQSNNPNGKAFDQARQSGEKPAYWRIMHRVTFHHSRKGCG